MKSNKTEKIDTYGIFCRSYSLLLAPILAIVLVLPLGFWYCTAKFWGWFIWADKHRYCHEVKYWGGEYDLSSRYDPNMDAFKRVWYKIIRL